MKRSDFSTKETFYMIKYVYQLFLEMQEKYSHLKDTEESYEFSFLNFNSTGQNIIMKPNRFVIYDESDDKYPVFEISMVSPEESVYESFELTNDYFHWYNGRHNKELCLIVGDHTYDWNKRYIYCSPYTNPEEIFEEYGEEYFFQQLTVQNIIPYELFQQEVNWYYNYVLSNIILEYISIKINLSDFNLKTLEGFRVI